ncbi:MAG: beta-ketoacyl synthase chain length factor [Chitinophagaceae bacterium]
MKFYINGMGTISSQLRDDEQELLVLRKLSALKNNCIEPKYANYISPVAIRRMSRVVKMGVASAKMALQNAQLDKPDLIILGTGYGCLQDTENFLESMILQNESMLSPSAFIQSTHNAVSGQIALQVKCFGHNFTYVQRAHSFELALQESMCWLQEEPNKEILVGGIDEMTTHSHTIIKRFGTYKKEDETVDSNSKGTLAGEGSSMFVLSTKKTEHTWATLIDIAFRIEAVNSDFVHSFLEKNNVRAEDISICLSGNNIDARYQAYYKNVEQLFACQKIYFKAFCGEFPTATGFAMALACSILYKQLIPIEEIENKEKIKYILIVNQYKETYSSLLLLEQA